MADILSEILSMARAPISAIADPIKMAYQRAANQQYDQNLANQQMADLGERPSISNTAISRSPNQQAILGIYDADADSSSGIKQNVSATPIRTTAEFTPASMVKTEPAITSGRELEKSSRASIDDLIGQLYAQRGEQKSTDDNLAWMNFFSKMAGSNSSSFLGAAGEGAKGLSDTMQAQEAARRERQNQIIGLDIKDQQWNREQTAKEAENASQDAERKSHMKYYDALAAQAGKSGGGRSAEFERLNNLLLDPELPPDERALIQTRLQTLARGGRDPFSTQLGKDTAESLEKSRENALLADDTLSLVGRMRKSFGEAGATGPIVGMLPNALVSTVSGTTAARQEVDSESSMALLDTAAKLKGSVSNYEDKIVGKTKPGLNIEEKTNQNMLDAMEAAALRARERPKFKETWLKMTNGDMTGEQSAWNKFVHDTSFIDVEGKKRPENLKLLRENENVWEAYLPNGSAKKMVVPKSTVPDGYKLIGTSGGKKVYQLPDGSHKMEQ